MDQQAINQAEWENPENWSVGFYFSKRDTRTWVPKSVPWMGWTLNLANSAGAKWMIGFLVGLPLMPVIAIILLSAFGSP